MTVKPRPRRERRTVWDWPGIVPSIWVLLLSLSVLAGLFGSGTVR